MLSAFARASSAVILPSATASFNFSVIIEVIAEARSSFEMPLDSATSPRVDPLRIPVSMSAFSIPRLSITDPRKWRTLPLSCFISLFTSLRCLSSVAASVSSNSITFSVDPFIALATNGIAMTTPANNEEETIATSKFFRKFLMVI